MSGRFPNPCGHPVPDPVLCYLLSSLFAAPHRRTAGDIPNSLPRAAQGQSNSRSRTRRTRLNLVLTARAFATWSPVATLLWRGAASIRSEEGMNPQVVPACAPPGYPLQWPTLQLLGGRVPENFNPFSSPFFRLLSFSVSFPMSHSVLLLKDSRFRSREHFHFNEMG